MRDMKLLIRLGIVLAIAVCLVVSTAFGQSPIQRSAYHDYRVVTWVDGLSQPWSIAFLPDGDVLVTEQRGTLRIIRNGALVEEPVPGVPEVHYQGQGGLMEVILHPEFASNRWVYLSYSKPYDDGDGATTAVIRARFENDRLEDVDEIFSAVARGRGHYGCKLAFDADGYLYITAGDRMVRPEGDLAAHPAQDVTNHHGTVSRVRDDGSVPDDNPFVDQEGAQPEIYSYGHRNPQGLAINQETGDVWITEHGPQGGDELNLIQPGVNYGWPMVGYGVNYRSGTAIHPGTMQEGTEHSVHVWVPSIAASGLMLYTGDVFPDWRGSLFAGGLAGEQVARLTMDGHEVVIEETLFHRLGRIRDVRQGPDGYIYLAIDGDEREDLTPILRIEPVDGDELVEIFSGSREV